MYFVSKLVAVTFLHSISIIVGQLEIGDQCQLGNGNGNGICKLIINCSEAIANIRKGIFPQQCGYQGTQAIVCCAQAETRKPPPPTTMQAPPPAIKRRISDQKCLDYSRLLWVTEINPSLIVGGEAVRRHECPFNREELVVGVDPAPRRGFPHMVQFGYDASDGLKWTCGGSLISEQFVLTAAHCLSDRSLGDAKHARMGIIDLKDDEHMQQFKIVERTPHPKHEEPSHYHDIGLAKLDKKAELNTWVRPACLYTNNASPKSNVMASGWGQIDFAGPASSILLKVTLELYNQTYCNKTFKRIIGTDKLLEGIKDEIMICAGHSKELKDTCQGDSGGPLQVYRDEEKLRCMFDIIGITSFGNGCGIAVNVPAGYTRVSYYLKWIEDIVWPAT